MAGLQRTSPRLKARVSPYHSGVTLYGMESTPPDTPRRQMHVKLEEEEAGPSTPGPSSSHEDSQSPLKKPALKSPQKSKSKTLYKKALATPHPAPERWREVYDCIKEMRKEAKAPVDTMGCHMAQRHETDPKTKDQVTDAAVRQAAVSLDAVLAADPTLISEAINKGKQFNVAFGMWRVKTKHLKLAAEKLRDEFDGDVPNTIEGLISLPGVGPKIGFLALQNAWNINVGIGVDVHVLPDNPEDARISLESWLPTELQRDINPLLVGFGQPPMRECALSAAGLCPSSKRGRP
ncbi:DNA glycosylase [Mycena alexandri]|uniref:DNA glycosylase n=1 Tax=Mycena alexandri TaxID=1745969 RepID=A0AAD6TBL8_9AGAR|nr:DNA glycosylase [Mycena alexandri]